MSKLGKIAMMYGLTATLADEFGSDYGIRETYREPELTEEEKQKERQERIIKQNLSKGLKLFNIQGEEIWALNEKNAIKKYNKK